MPTYSQNISKQIQTENYKNAHETFESKMVKNVMNDAYMQYKASTSIDMFTYDTSSDDILTFSNSFSNSSYQGVIEIEEKKPYKYYIKSAIIYWEVYDPHHLKKFYAGEIDINKFYQDNGIGINSKCPTCVWFVVVGTVGCIATVALCNQRCNNCMYGASSCSSSCWTNSCQVVCNSAPDPQNNSFLFRPWNAFNDILLQVGSYVVDPR